MSGRGKLLIIFACRTLNFTSGTEDQCHTDCTTTPRPVGPTRPWNAVDPLGNSLHLTRPHPYHIAANDVNKNQYEFHTFCQLGCTFFYGSSSSEDTYDKKITTLDQCYDKCDETYGYTSTTPPYNDLSEIARLECRDGCLIALKRCQPGYYCIPPFFPDGSGTDNAKDYEGGDMIPCPAGTFRDVSYEDVTKCTPCPPNHYREDVKGRRLSSCSPCPSGTSAVNSGSTSINDCVRCPAGTFSTEASFCICITPQACAREQLPYPADAEKKDSVPYIGRW